MIKIERKNKIEDGQVEIESQPDDKDDKNEFNFPRKFLPGLESVFFAEKFQFLQPDSHQTQPILNYSKRKI